MPQISHPQGVAIPLLANVLAIAAIGMFAVTSQPVLAAGDGTAHREAPRRLKPSAKPLLDFSGRRRIGIASFYADWFAGRKMANGAVMNPHSDNAASRTLPLGTIARVTNLKTHKTAVVSIQDRGPYVQGRIVDLSPFTARKIGITRKMGIARVRVTPIAIPRRDGRMELASQLSAAHRADHRRCECDRVAFEQHPKARQIE
jgi:rare lipoprotein A